MGDGVLLTYPGSNQNVLSDLLALQRADLLALFCTTIAWDRGRGLIRRLPSSLRQELERRVFEGVDSRRIRTFPGRELVHQAARRLGLTALTRHETGWASVDSVSRAFDRRVARLVRRGSTHASAVYGYEYASLDTFEAAGEMGMRRFYELTIGYWRAGLRILTEERELNPEWAPTLEILRDSSEKQARKDAELSMADHVIVPSEFVRKTLVEHPGFSAIVDVIPYGAPPPRPAALAARARAAKLRLLYVGHLSQRKGISYLFAAMRALQGVATLTLVGPKPAPECPALDRELYHYEWLGTVPHKRVLDIMRQHDLFVFPSLFEGMALVVLEALAQGLPVITTYNSGAGMAISEGQDGFLVSIRDTEAIAARVLELARDRDRLASMSAAALRKAERMSWAARERRLIDTLRGRMGAGNL
jgi:starch synthase